MKFFILIFTSLFVLSCGHYRPQSSGYRGLGEYHIPFEGRSPAAESYDLSYTPRGPFQVAWPVRFIKINRGYRPVRAPRHEGVDLGGKKETPILAAHEGVVIYTGHDFRGYGNMVLLEYDNEWATLYAHLSTISVRAGQIVRTGDFLGGMGRTGDATGIHLHFELLHNRQPIDPLPVLSRGRQFAGLK